MGSERGSGKEYFWREIPIPLVRVAHFDECDAPDGLPAALGDRYLCLNNPVFASVRRAAFRNEYRFCCADTPLWRDYQAFPLMFLDCILRDKVIPYRDTARTLRRLSERHSGMALSAAYLGGNMTANYAFHESAHCIAHSVLLNAKGLAAASRRERFAIESLLAEAFANTIETLGTLAEGNPIADEIFYPLNSFMRRNQKESETLRSASALSDESRFRLLFLAYFEANVSRDMLDEFHVSRIKEAAHVPASDEIIRAITEIAFGLSRGFRTNTTPAYFSHLGYGPEFTALTQSAWLTEPANAEIAREVTGLLYDEIFQKS